MSARLTLPLGTSIMDLSAQPAASPAPHSYINRQQAFPAKNYATTNKKKKKSVEIQENYSREETQSFIIL